MIHLQESKDRFDNSIYTETKTPGIKDYGQGTLNNPYRWLMLQQSNQSSVGIPADLNSDSIWIQVPVQKDVQYTMAVQTSDSAFLALYDREGYLQAACNSLKPRVVHGLGTWNYIRYRALKTQSMMLQVLSRHHQVSDSSAYYQYKEPHIIYQNDKYTLLDNSDSTKGNSSIVYKDVSIAQSDNSFKPYPLKGRLFWSRVLTEYIFDEPQYKTVLPTGCQLSFSLDNITGHEIAFTYYFLIFNSYLKGNQRPSTPDQGNIQYQIQWNLTNTYLNISLKRITDNSVCLIINDQQSQLFYLDDKIHKLQLNIPSYLPTYREGDLKYPNIDTVQRASKVSRQYSIFLDNKLISVYKQPYLYMDRSQIPYVIEQVTGVYEDSLILTQKQATYYGGLILHKKSDTVNKNRLQLTLRSHKLFQLLTGYQKLKYKYRHLYTAKAVMTQSFQATQTVYIPLHTDLKTSTGALPYRNSSKNIEHTGDYTKGSFDIAWQLPTNIRPSSYTMQITLCANELRSDNLQLFITSDPNLTYTKGHWNASGVVNYNIVYNSQQYGILYSIYDKWCTLTVVMNASSQYYKDTFHKIYKDGMLYYTCPNKSGPFNSGYSYLILRGRDMCCKDIRLFYNATAQPSDFQTVEVRKNKIKESRSFRFICQRYPQEPKRAPVKHIDLKDGLLLLLPLKNSFVPVTDNLLLNKYSDTYKYTADAQGNILFSPKQYLHTQLPFVSGDSSYAICYWTKLSLYEIGKTFTALSRNNYSYDNGDTNFIYRTADKIKVAVGSQRYRSQTDGSYITYDYTASDSVQAPYVWHHIYTDYSNGTQRLIVDGNLQSIKTLKGRGVNNQSVQYFGINGTVMHNNDLAYTGSGFYKDVRVYSRKLTDLQIQKIYKQQGSYAAHPAIPGDYITYYPVDLGVALPQGVEIKQYLNIKAVYFPKEKSVQIPYKMPTVFSISFLASVDWTRVQTIGVGYFTVKDSTYDYSQNNWRFPLMLGAYGGTGRFCYRWASGYQSSTNQDILGDCVWHHYCCTYNGQYFRVYVDGIQVGSKSQQYKWNKQDIIEIGCGVTSTMYFRSLRIYDRALNKTQIHQLAKQLFIL